ncbi:hypothetical protein CUMW_088410 [Citrus unshiu]|nr:hypothetical protein CUMW_088410 [Citrus unshiu]
MREEFEKCEASAGEEGTVKNLFTYMVTDDLSVTPLLMTSGIISMLLNNLSVLEKRLVELSNDEVLELLENAMNSRTALTSASQEYFARTALTYILLSYLCLMYQITKSRIPRLNLRTY